MGSHTHNAKARKLIVIALETFREALRNPVTGTVFGIAVFLVVISPSFAVFGFGAGVEMVATLGLGTALVSGVLLGGIWAGFLFGERLRDRRAMLTLAAPVGRGTYFAGRLGGVLLAEAVVMANIVVVLRGTVSFMQPAVGWGWLLVVGAGVLLVAGVSVGLHVRGKGRSSGGMAFWLGWLVVGLVVTSVLPGGRGAWPSWDAVLLVGWAGALAQVAIACAVTFAVAVKAPVAVLPGVAMLVLFAGHAVGGMGGVVPDLGSIESSGIMFCRGMDWSVGGEIGSLAWNVLLAWGYAALWIGASVVAGVELLRRSDIA